MEIFIKLFFILDSPDKLTDDWEIQNWGNMLADPEEGLGIKVQSNFRRQTPPVKT